VIDYQPGDFIHFGRKCVRYLWLADRLMLLIDPRPEYQHSRRIPRPDRSFDMELQTMCHPEVECDPVRAMYRRLAKAYRSR
jgi:hypothetical protein